MNQFLEKSSQVITDTEGGIYYYRLFGLQFPEAGTSYQCIDQGILRPGLSYYLCRVGKNIRQTT